MLGQFSAPDIWGFAESFTGYFKCSNAQKLGKRLWVPNVSRRGSIHLTPRLVATCSASASTRPWFWWTFAGARDIVAGSPRSRRREVLAQAGSRPASTTRFLLGKPQRCRRSGVTADESFSIDGARWLVPLLRASGGSPFGRLQGQVCLRCLTVFLLKG
jgi:hypothetical protein